jgi:hypothetical protein
MWFPKRRHGREAEQVPSGPETLIGLLWAVSESWGRTMRLIVVVSALIVALCVGAALGIDVIILAEKGIHTQAHYVLPAEIFSGGTVATTATLLLKKWWSIMNRRNDADNGGKRTRRSLLTRCHTPDLRLCI